MRKRQKPDTPDVNSGSSRRLTRRAILGALAAGSVAGARGATSPRRGKLPEWYLPCKKNYVDRIAKATEEERELLELELLSLQMEAIHVNKISAARDHRPGPESKPTATPTPRGK